jgi:ELWxxDGT repeat protein
MFHRSAFLLGLALAASQSLPAMAQAQPCQRAGRVKDIRAGAAGAFPSSGDVAPVAIGGTLFFVADDGETGLELWKSDGTAAGTVRVRTLLLAAGARSRDR